MQIILSWDDNGVVQGNIYAKSPEQQRQLDKIVNILTDNTRSSRLRLVANTKLFLDIELPVVPLVKIDG
jgi:hypothetical protein